MPPAGESAHRRQRPQDPLLLRRQRPLDLHRQRARRSQPERLQRLRRSHRHLSLHQPHQHQRAHRRPRHRRSHHPGEHHCEPHRRQCRWPQHVNYTLRGAVKQAIDALGNTTNYSYNAFGNLATKDAAQNAATVCSRATPTTNAGCAPPASRTSAASTALPVPSTTPSAG